MAPQRQTAKTPGRLKQKDSMSETIAGYSVKTVFQKQNEVNKKVK